ncbi:MAG: hypothetical protein QOJ55_2542 [Solirubrobacteraceae bacterium]|jgi:hypothetical protein|nr:hypothetical protein [Solirubrobacteraceae bacterium]
MEIRTRMSISADGFLTTPSGVAGADRRSELRLRREPWPLVLERERSLPGGSVEIVYACS